MRDETRQVVQDCAAALQAGCVGYIVSMVGRRVVYFGRSGDSHVEWFPGAGPGAPD